MPRVDRRALLKSAACVALGASAGLSVLLPSKFDPIHEDKSGAVCHRLTDAGEEQIEFENLRKGDRVKFDYGVGYLPITIATVHSDPVRTLIGTGPRWTWGCTIRDTESRYAAG